MNINDRLGDGSIHMNIENTAAAIGSGVLTDFNDAIGCCGP